MESSSSFLGTSKRAKAPANIGQVPNCLVDGCGADLSLCKDYHRRHKVCEAHSKTPRVTIAGREQRFCQQCSRFHSLVEFDEGKRSCRKRLDGHNRRRRKPQPECMSRNPGLVFSTHLHGAGDHPHLLSFSSPQMLPTTSAVLSSSSNWAENHDNMLYNTQQQQLINYINPPSSSSSSTPDPNASHCALSLLSPPTEFHNVHYPFAHDSAALHISAPIFHHPSEGGSSTAGSHQTLNFTWE